MNTHIKSLLIRERIKRAIEAFVEAEVSVSDPVEGKPVEKHMTYRTSAYFASLEDAKKLASLISKYLPHLGLPHLGVIVEERTGLNKVDNWEEYQIVESQPSRAPERERLTAK